MKPIGPLALVEAWTVPGLVIDLFELEGTDNFEVLFVNGDRGWFMDLELRIINE